MKLDKIESIRDSLKCRIGYSNRIWYLKSERASEERRVGRYLVVLESYDRDFKERLDRLEERRYNVFNEVVESCSDYVVRGLTTGTGVNKS